MPYGDDDDLHDTVVDFLDHPVIAGANPPWIAPFELFHIRRTRVGLQSGQPFQNLSQLTTTLKLVHHTLNASRRFWHIIQSHAQKMPGLQDRKISQAANNGVC